MELNLPQRSTNKQKREALILEKIKKVSFPFLRVTMKWQIADNKLMFEKHELKFLWKNQPLGRVSRSFFCRANRFVSFDAILLKILDRHLSFRPIFNRLYKQENRK